MRRRRYHSIAEKQHASAAIRGLCDAGHSVHASFSLRRGVAAIGSCAANDFGCTRPGADERNIFARAIPHTSSVVQRTVTERQYVRFSIPAAGTPASLFIFDFQQQQRRRL